MSRAALPIVTGMQTQPLIALAFAGMALILYVMRRRVRLGRKKGTF